MSQRYAIRLVVRETREAYATFTRRPLFHNANGAPDIRTSK